MSGYERPTDKGNGKVTVSFWAMLCREGLSIHGYARPSPKFATQRDLTAWVREHRQEGDEVRLWRRESRESGSNDYALIADDEPKPDPARLHALVGELKSQIEARKRVLDRAMKAHPAGKST